MRRYQELSEWFAQREEMAQRRAREIKRQDRLLVLVSLCFGAAVLLVIYLLATW